MSNKVSLSNDNEEKQQMKLVARNDTVCPSMEYMV